MRRDGHRSHGTSDRGGEAEDRVPRASRTKPDAAQLKPRRHGRVTVLVIHLIILLAEGPPLRKNPDQDWREPTENVSLSREDSD